MKHKKKWKIIALALCAVFFIGLVVHWASAGAAGVYVTEEAVNFVADERVPLKGVVMRHAQVVSKTDGSVVCYLVEDGSRVAKGQALGYLCKSEEEAKARLEIQRLDSHIALLKEAGENVALVNTQYESLTNRMNNAVLELLENISAGDYSTLSACEQVYIPASARRELAVDKSVNFDATLHELEERRKTLASSIPSNPQMITAPVAGYFSRGGQFLLSPEEAEGMSAAEVLALTGAEFANAAGTISPDYTWSFLGVADASYAKVLNAGDKIELDLNLKSGALLPARIVSVTKDASDETKLLVEVSCSYMDPEIAGMSNAKIDLVVNRHSGIRVSKDALRFDGSVPGVYVMGQRVMRFKKIEILFEGENFLICRMNTTDASSLRLYDEVIVKGADLYDGKAC